MGIANVTKCLHTLKKLTIENLYSLVIALESLGSGSNQTETILKESTQGVKPANHPTALIDANWLAYKLCSNDDQFFPAEKLPDLLSHLPKKGSLSR